MNTILIRLKESIQTKQRRQKAIQFLIPSLICTFLSDSTSTQILSVAHQIYQWCGTTWTSSKQKSGSSLSSIAAEEKKIATSIHYSQNSFLLLLAHLLTYLASTTWLPLQAISLTPTHPHECSAATKNHEVPSSRQPFLMQSMQTLAIRIRNWSWSAATHERDG
jgi:hypothetical protein